MPIPGLGGLVRTSLALCIVFSGCGQRGGIRPGVYVSPAVHSLGTVHNVQRLRENFEIVNTSDKDVRLLGSSQSCGCTSVELSSQLLPAGGTVTATLTVDVAGQFGRKDFEARIQTTSESNPVIRFGITADLAVTEVEGDTTLELGRLPPHGEVSREFPIYKGSVSSARPVGCDPATTGSFAIDLRDADTPGFFILTVAGSAPREAGEFHYPIAIKSEGGSWRTRRVVLHGSVVTRWRAPSVVSLGFLQKGRPREVEIEIEDACAGPPNPAVRHARAVTTGNWLSAEAGVGSRGRVIVRLSGNHPGVTEPVNGRVTVELETEDGPSALVSIAVTARGVD